MQNRHLLSRALVVVACATGCGGGESKEDAQRADSSGFRARCAQPGVIRCVSFDTAADFAGRYGDVSGIQPVGDEFRASRDTAQKASGTSSLKFTIPSNSAANTSGSYFTNFSDDLSVQFGGDSEFYIQWRQRFSSELVAHRYLNSDGWKQLIVGAGDTPGKTRSSCTAIHLVVQNYYVRGFPIMYNSCTGSTSHGAYDFFKESFNGDWKFQNARPAPYCLRSQQSTSYFAPTGNCFGYAANEWMTFQLHVKTGPRVGDEFKNSYVTLWAARQGKPMEEVIRWGPYNLTAGYGGDNMTFGKVWLLPYQTNKDSSESHPTAYTWYDDLIISKNRIADPALAARPATARSTAAE